MKKRVGVLALQGDFEAHGRALERAGAEPVYVRSAGELEGLHGMVLPGGESTTMLKLLRAQGLFEELKAFAQSRPVFGTCAGVILMANDVVHPSQESLGLLDLSVERNAYGRQIDSTIARLAPSEEFESRTFPGQLEAVFIRAPIIRRAGEKSTVLAEFRDEPVLVEQGRHLVATFHPELTADSRVHQLFLQKL